MKTQNSNSLADSVRSGFAAVIIPVELTLAYLFYFFVLGAEENFDASHHPINYLGTVHEGGPAIVPILISLLMMTLTFAIERLLTISKAKGKGSVRGFVQKIRTLLATGNIKQAIDECDKQKGSVANVVKAGLSKYSALQNDPTLDAEQKVLLIQKDIEETTQLEMPMLEKNLVIIATIASIATLMGLLGTVLGMINAFAAMAQAGAPDAVKLASGISEALINTALGIGTSAIAIVFYNYFTSAIDALTYGIDETSYSIVQNFTAKTKA